jgi:AAA15 family ATPase/GTPase
MGDGIFRLLTIALAIPEARNGEVLIDEIENGLYYSVMSDVWESLAKLAEIFNAQLFATTHSEECIRAAAEVFSKKNDKGQFLLHRLEANKNRVVHPVTISLDKLVEALEIGLEVR